MDCSAANLRCLSIPTTPTPCKMATIFVASCYGFVYNPNTSKSNAAPASRLTRECFISPKMPRGEGEECLKNLFRCCSPSPSSLIVCHSLSPYSFGFRNNSKLQRRISYISIIHFNTLLLPFTLYQFRQTGIS